MTTIKFENITAGDHDIYVDVTAEGTREEIVEKVAMHARDEAVRAMQAFDTGKPPEECRGCGISVRWEDTLEEFDGGDE